MKQLFLKITLLLSLCSFGNNLTSLIDIVKIDNNLTIQTDNCISIDRNFNLLSIPKGFANSSWVISEDHDLKGNTVLLPANVNLRFDGGSFRNGTLVGRDTKITANLAHVFNSDIVMRGSWDVERVNPIWFGAIGDGCTDDSESLEKALNFGGKIDLLNKKYVVTRELKNASDFELFNGTITSKAHSNSAIIVNSSKDIKVSNVVSSGDVTFIRQTTSFDNITINSSTFTGGSNSITNYMLLVDRNSTGNTINLGHNETHRATLLFADDVSANVCNVENNHIFQPTRFAVRSLNQGSGKVLKIMNFNNNHIYDGNGDLEDKSYVSRCLQIETSEITNANNNVVDGAESTTAANFIYNHGGSLIASNNLIKNIKGHIDKAVIDDKAVVITNNYFWKIENNTFDFSGITLAESPEAMIRVNESRNVTVSNNTFKGLKCFAVRVYHSVDTGNYPENINIADNKVYNSEFPVAFQVFQNIKNVVIENNLVNEITNPTALKVSGRSEVRIVDIYQSFSNGSNLDGVLIKGNVLKTSVPVAFICTLYRNKLAVNSDIVNVTITNNEMKSSSNGAFVRITGAGASAFELKDNIGISGVSETIGVEPAGTRKVNNQKNK